MLPRGDRASVWGATSEALRWHRDLVRRRWTYPRTGRRDRRCLPEEVVELVVRLAKEDRRWGYLRVRREALIDRVGVRDLRLRPVVASRLKQAGGGPIPGDAGEGGKRP
jgi:putative transposase